MLQPLFRLIAAAGLYHLYLDHQRRLHTLVSSVRGPDRPLTLFGAPIAAIVPVSVAEAGNLTVNFLALSYAGTLTVTVVADPDRVVDLPVLARALQVELDALTIAPTLRRWPGTSTAASAVHGRAVRDRCRSDTALQ